MKNQKVWIAVLSVLLCVVMLAACGDKKEDGHSTPPESVVPEAPIAPTEPDEPEPPVAP